MLDRRRRTQAEPRSLVRVSLRAKLAPHSGIMDEAFEWHDVLNSPFPTHDPDASRRLVLPAGEVEAGSHHVANVLVVTAAPDGSLVGVEDRLAVSPRVLGEMIEAERALPSLLRRVTRPLARLPDRVARHARRAHHALASPEGRAKVRRGFSDPGSLDGNEKAVALFVASTSLVAIILVAHLAVTLIVPDLARAWRNSLLLFGYAFVTSLGIPLPLEPLLLGAVAIVGPYNVVALALSAKLTAAWLVLFFGDSLNKKAEKLAEKYPIVARTLHASERFAKRYGLFAVAVFIAIPGFPDFVALYVFSSLGMPMRKFLLGVAMGGVVLYSVVAFGLGHLVWGGS